MLYRPLVILTATASFTLFGCSGENPTTTTTSAADSTAAAPSAVAAASTALGLEGMQSLTYSGSAWRIRNSFRQTPNATPPWPSHDEITNYRRTLDLSDATQPASLARGDTLAQDLFLNPAVAGTYTQNVAATQKAWGQQLEIWLTPWGFLKGAAQYGATEASTTLDGAAVTAVTWQSPTSQLSPGGLQYTVTGYINAEHLVTRVETKVEDAFMGDMGVVALYSDYHKVNDVMMPATMEQQRGGGGIFGVTVDAASINPANLSELMATTPPPAPPAGGAPAPASPAELSVAVGDGVYWIKTGYTALAVGFADYVAVFEAGGSESIGEQIVAEVKRLFPGKPIRYLINSHPHSDHTGGMVPLVREGATIITHANNVDFLKMALSTPRTLLGQPTLTPKFEAANDIYVLEDATRRFELHRIANDHSDGTLVGYLPKERVLIEADFTLPVNGAKANPFVINLANYVDSHGLDFDQYLAVHMAQVPQTKKDLMATIGK
jgi:glyoxylase-like metal-dependent hydrolase (beta-lactamase superfamily II)